MRQIDTFFLRLDKNFCRRKSLRNKREVSGDDRDGEVKTFAG